MIDVQIQNILKVNHDKFIFQNHFTWFVYAVDIQLNDIWLQ